MAFNPITPIQISASGFVSGWNTVQVGGNYGVPSSASGVMLVVQQPASRSGILAVRVTCASPDTFGSTNGILASNYQLQMTSGLGTGIYSGQMDFYNSSSPAIYPVIYVMGYYGTETTFFNNAVSLGALTTSYQTFNITSQSSSAIAAIITTSSSPYAFWARYGISGSGGSTDNYSNNNGSGSSVYQIVGVDSGQNFQAKNLSGTQPNLMLLGYMTSGLTYHTNAINVSPGTAGSWVNLTNTTGANAVLYYLTSATGSLFGLAQILDQTFNLQSFPGQGVSGFNMCMTPPSINIASTTPVVYELGYFTGTVATTAPQPLGGPSRIQWHWR